MTENPIMKNGDIQSRIYTIRDVQVMLDIDLAEFYGVEVKRLNEQVKRNIERFPQEFSFQLTAEENNALRSQFVTLEESKTMKSKIVTSNGKTNLKSQYATSSWGGRRTAPYAFTEQGVAMLSAELAKDSRSGYKRRGKNESFT
ncbi:MAG TPA: ORF6N domain-containing protein [Desulfatiglandales bacterium]|nr:ORF6N domain-containing protein [Desulfatiglandales bacterium]